MTSVEKTKGNGNRGASLPVFLAGLGTGIVLTVLITSSSTALRSGIERGAHWMKGRAAAAKDEALTQAAGLRDGVKAAVETATQS